MCPACVASAAWIAGSMMSTGGIAALAVKMVRGKRRVDRNDNPNGTQRRGEITMSTMNAATTNRDGASNE